MNMKLLKRFQAIKSVHSKDIQKNKGESTTTQEMVKCEDQSTWCVLSEYRVKWHNHFEEWEWHLITLNIFKQKLPITRNKKSGLHLIKATYENLTAT